MDLQCLRATFISLSDPGLMQRAVDVHSHDTDAVKIDIDGY
jgi:hypothetical protein